MLAGPLLGLRRSNTSSLYTCTIDIEIEQCFIDVSRVKMNLIDSGTSPSEWLLIRSSRPIV